MNVEMGMDNVIVPRDDGLHTGGNVLLLQDAEIRRADQQSAVGVNAACRMFLFMGPQLEWARHRCHQFRRRLRSGCCKQSHLVPTGNQFFGEIVNHFLPRSVSIRRNRPGNGASMAIRSGRQCESSISVSCPSSSSNTSKYHTLNRGQAGCPFHVLRASQASGERFLAPGRCMCRPHHSRG